jgi:multiple RNA-binding domain-containing protein 1
MSSSSGSVSSGSVSASGGSSRICVKNLPKNMTEAKLREVFAARGEVTDVRIAKNEKGQSRFFGFVGFRTNDEAQHAVRFFHGTFIQATKISVELAKKVGDSSLVGTALSKHSKNHSAKPGAPTDTKGHDDSNNEAKASTKSSTSTAALTPAERKKREFMEIMKSRSSAGKNFWGNDDNIIAVNAELQQSIDNPEASDEEDNMIDGNSDNEYEEMDNTVIEKEPSPSKKSSKQLSDLDFLKSKISSQHGQADNQDDEENVGNDNEDDNEESTKKSTKKQKHTDDGKNKMRTDDENQEEGNNDDIVTGRLFIRNLPFSCTEDELTELFTAYGPVCEVHLPLDSNKRGKGFGFVQFMMPENAMNAKDGIDGTSFQGRLIHIIHAKDKTTSALSGTDGDGTNASGGAGGRMSEYQKKKDAQRKAMASIKDSWNASYVRSEAVVSSLAEKYGISQIDILNSADSGGDMAVKLAIGEATVIADNRKYFLDHGIDINALESATSGSNASKRSNTTLLVKNLPPNLVEAELEAMFTR